MRPVFFFAAGPSQAHFSTKRRLPTKLVPIVTLDILKRALGEKVKGVGSIFLQVQRRVDESRDSREPVPYYCRLSDSDSERNGAAP